MIIDSNFVLILSSICHQKPRLKKYQRKGIITNSHERTHSNIIVKVYTRLIKNKCYGYYYKPQIKSTFLELAFVIITQRNIPPRPASNLGPMNKRNLAIMDLTCLELGHP